MTSPVGALWWWPARLSPLAVLPLLVYLALWAFSSDGSGWGYVLFPLLAVGLLVAGGYGLFVGVLAALALRTWPGEARTCATVTALASVLPVAVPVVTGDDDDPAAALGGARPRRRVRRRGGHDGRRPPDRAVPSAVTVAAAVAGTGGAARCRGSGPAPTPVSHSAEGRPGGSRWTGGFRGPCCGGRCGAPCWRSPGCSAWGSSRGGCSRCWVCRAAPASCAAWCPSRPRRCPSSSSSPWSSASSRPPPCVAGAPRFPWPPSSPVLAGAVVAALAMTWLAPDRLLAVLGAVVVGSVCGVISAVGTWSDGRRLDPRPAPLPVVGI